MILYYHQHHLSLLSFLISCIGASLSAGKDYHLPPKGSSFNASAEQHPNSVLSVPSSGPLPPEFIHHPNNSFIIRNKNVSLTCSVVRSIKAYFVCNGEAMAVTEFHSEKDRLNENNELEKTLTLLVNRIQVEEFFGTFVCHCDAWYERGKVASRNATVELAYLRKEFEVPPYSQNVEQGSQIQLNCHPPKGIPTPRIYWLKDRVEVQPERDPNYIQAADGHLIIIQAREKDRANYTCVAENVANRRMSPPARLGVYVTGGWSEWSAWSSCNGKCGSSYVSRTRKCDNPPPRWGGPECEGLFIQRNKCTHHLICPVIEAIWSPWGSWSTCSDDCVRSRVRKCSEGNSCRGKDRILLACNEGKCKEKRTYFGANPGGNDTAQEIVEKDLSLLVGLSVAIVVFLVITLISIKFLRRKGSGRGGGSMFSMTNLSYGETVKNEILKKDHQSSDSPYMEDPDVVVTFKASDKKFSDFRCPTRGSSSNAYSITDDETTHLTKLCYDSLQSTPYSDKKLLLQGNKILPGDSSMLLTPPSQSPRINTRVNPRFMLPETEDEHQYDIPFGHINASRPPPELPPPPAPDASHPWTQDPSLLQPRLIQGFNEEEEEGGEHHSSSSNPSSVSSSLSNSQNLEAFTLNRRALGSLNLDPESFTYSSVTSNGSVISLENLGITLTIPEGALEKGYTEDIFLTLMSEGRDVPRLSSIQTLLSPVILSGPPRLSFKKPVILSFGHSANRRKELNSWELGIYHCDSLFSDEAGDSPEGGEVSAPWVKLATLGRESLSSPIITIVESETVHIMTDFLTRFCLVGQSSLSSSGKASKKLDVYVLCKPVSSNLDYSLLILLVDKNRASLSKRLSWARKRNYGLLASESFLFQDGGKGIRSLIDDLSMGWSFKCKSGQTLPFDSLWSNNVSRGDKNCLLYSLSRLDPLIKSISFSIVLKQEGEELRIPIIFEADPRFPSPLSSHEPNIKSLKPTFRLPSGIKRRLSSALDASKSWQKLTKELGLEKFDSFFSSRSPSPSECVLSLWEVLEDDAMSREGKVSKLIAFLKNNGRDDLGGILEKEYGPWI